MSWFIETQAKHILAYRKQAANVRTIKNKHLRRRLHQKAREHEEALIALANNIIMSDFIEYVSAPVANIGKETAL